MTALNTITN